MDNEVYSPMLWLSYKFTVCKSSLPGETEMTIFCGFYVPVQLSGAAFRMSSSPFGGHTF